MVERRIHCLKVAGAVNLSGGGAGGDVAAAMLEWEEGDRYSFEDSDRFEEDSLCSWSSEPESLCNNWRGWKRPQGASAGSFSFQGSGKQHRIDGECARPETAEGSLFSGLCSGERGRTEARAAAGSNRGVSSLFFHGRAVYAAGGG